MFETSRRTHPLHTFRFWFVVLAACAITVAWKFDLLPVRIGPADTGRLAEETFTEIDPPESSLAKASHAAAPLPFTHDESPVLPTITPAETSARNPTVPQTAVRDEGALFAGQSEPAMTANEAASPSAGETASLFDEDEWPVSSQTASTGTTASATAAVTTSPEIVQTNATSTAFESTTTPGLRPADQALLDNTRPEPATTAGPAVDFTEIDQLLATGQVADEIDAHRLLSTRYWQQPESREALQERIDRLAQQIYFQSGRHYMEPYEVQPGEMLQNIARDYDVTWQYLAKLNRVDPRRVRAGQRLKVIKGPFSAIVDLSDYELTIHAHGYFVTRYPVGIGKDGSSPIGKFSVQEKLIDPTYYGPDGVVNHDDPANPLGERWIDIGNSFGIHGTIDPASIGKNESQGCIRLHNDDVEAVYDLLTIGSEVVIRP